MSSYGRQILFVSKKWFLPFVEVYPIRVAGDNLNL